MTHAPDPPASPATRLGWLPVFDSAAFAPGECYDAWRGADVERLSARYETRPREPFAVAMDWLDLGTLGVGRVQITAQDWARGRQEAVRDGFDELVVNIRHAGAAEGEMGGRRVIAPAGSIVLADMTGSNHHASEASVCTGLVLPRAVAERLLPPVRSLHGHVVPPAQAALLVSHLAMLHRHAADLPASSGPAVARTIVDLLVMSVNASLDRPPADAESHERGLLVQLRAEIEHNLGSPSLTAARLSRTLGVSRSTLYRLLQREGGVQAYVRGRRLARIAETLRQPGDRQTIAALAERWGFCDAAYLGRAFREAYGMTPGDYRAAHSVVVQG